MNTISFLWAKMLPELLSEKKLWTESLRTFGGLGHQVSGSCLFSVMCFQIYFKLDKSQNWAISWGSLGIFFTGWQRSSMFCLLLTEFIYILDVCFHLLLIHWWRWHQLKHWVQAAAKCRQVRHNLDQGCRDIRFWLHDYWSQTNAP